MAERRVKRTIFYSGSVGTSTGAVISSNIFTHQFEIQKVHCNFVQGTDNTVKIYVISSDNSTSTGTSRATTPGYNVFSGGNMSSSEPYMVGDGYIALGTHFIVPENNYLMVLAINADASYSHSVEVRVEGEELFT